MNVVKQVLARPVRDPRPPLFPHDDRPLILGPGSPSADVLDVCILRDPDDGFILRWSSRMEGFDGGTWHPTIGGAEKAAKAYFSITRREWRPPLTATKRTRSR